MRVLKQRHEKFKTEELGKVERILLTKESEVQVMKEMVKSTNLVVKAKEKDIQRLKQRVTYAEG